MKVDDNDTFTNSDGHRERAFAIEEVINLDKKGGNRERMKQYIVVLWYS